MTRRLRVLHPLSAWGGAHVQTCINILKGMEGQGIDLHLDLPRANVDMTGLPHSVTLGGPLARRPLTRFQPWLAAQAERRFLAGLREGDVTWLWPDVSTETVRAVAARGHPIIMEGINTRIAHARAILRRAYEAYGADHRDAATYSDARVAKEDAELALATHFFSSNPGTDRAILEPGSGFSGQVMKSSFGAWWPEDPGVDRRGRTGPVTFLFMGSVGVRKNAHGLLAAWAKARPENARLVLCGGVEPVVAEKSADAFALPEVEARGHVTDVDAAYREADVFVMPSFEEGGPQVNYEAGGFALPIIASPFGAGRMTGEENGVTMIDPWSVDDMAAAILRLAGDAELRLDHGAKARAAARRYDWRAIGADRAALLKAAFPDL